MKTLLLAALASLCFSASAYAQSCYQSFQIDPSKVVPALPDTFDTGVYGGMQCAELENYRAAIYVDNLLRISDSELADLSKWQAARQLYLTKLGEAEKRLEEAQSSEEIQTAVTVALHYTGYGLTLAGCNPSAVAGIPALVCVGGFVVTQAGTVWSFATMGSDRKHAQAALNDMRALLESHNTLSSAELNEAVSDYQTEFENTCSIVKAYCLE